MSTTNYDLQGGVGSMLTGINQMYNVLDGIAKTPSNDQTRHWVDQAYDAATDAYATIPSNSLSPSEVTIAAFKNAKVKFKVAKSVVQEFSPESDYTSLSRMEQAFDESIKQLPQTLADAGEAVGDAVGGLAGGVGNFGAEAIKNAILQFFKSLGWFGWILLFLAGLGVLTYFYPGWIGAAKGLVTK